MSRRASRVPASGRGSARERIERGIYRYPLGRSFGLEVCWEEDGRTRWRRLGAVNLTNARIARADAQAAARHRPPTLPDPTFEEYARAWVRQEAHVGKATLVKRQSVLDHHLGNLADKRISAITTADIESWIAQLRATPARNRHRVRTRLSEGTVHDYFKIIDHILRTAAAEGRTERNPARLLGRRRRPQAATARKRGLTASEIAALLDASRGMGRVLLATAILTGMRVSELLGLIWAEVDFEQGVFRVRAQLSRGPRGERGRQGLKTSNSVRDIVMNEKLEDLLAEHRRRSRNSRPGDFVFAAVDGASLSESYVRQHIFEPAAKTAGLNSDLAQRGVEKAVVHTLRHTFASMLIAAPDRDDFFISRQLGHGSPLVTYSVYAHFYDQHKHAAAARRHLAHEFEQILDPNRPSALDRLPVTMGRQTRLASGPRVFSRSTRRHGDKPPRRSRRA